jgi:hypothetical protein
MIRHNDSLVRSRIMRGALACSMLALAACQQGEQAAAPTQDSAMEWARAALERNPQLELVATDANAEVFTVRDRQTGETRAIKLNELAAAPVAQLAQRTPPTSPAPATQTAAPEQVPSSGAETAGETARTAATPEQQPATPSDRERQATASQPAANYTIERSEGQVRVSGPGVSIVSSGNAAQGHEGVSRSNAVEPIICEGKRMVHFDGRQIYVEGDAITVRGGCEIHITNSRVVATGTGIVVQDGIAHISNSEIEGQEGSFDANNQAKLFVRASTFRGVPRRAEQAVVQDQGGNRWR